MVMPREEKKFVENQIKLLLQDRSLEQILEDFDLDPAEVLFYLFESGQLDPEIMENIVV